MSDDKFKLLVVGLREALIVFLNHIEDYLGTPYDISALAKRQEKAKQRRA